MSLLQNFPDSQKLSGQHSWRADGVFLTLRKNLCNPSLHFHCSLSNKSATQKNFSNNYAFTFSELKIAPTKHRDTIIRVILFQSFPCFCIIYSWFHAKTCMIKVVKQKQRCKKIVPSMCASKDSQHWCIDYMILLRTTWEQFWRKNPETVIHLAL